MCDITASVGVYPLFNPSAADLGGAALRAHITVTAGSVPHTHQAPTLTEEEMQLSSSGEEEEDKGPSPIQSPTPNTQSRQHCGSLEQTKSVQSSTVITSDNTFTATVSVERAMHLSLKGKICCRNNSVYFFPTGSRNYDNINIFIGQPVITLLH